MADEKKINLSDEEILELIQGDIEKAESVQGDLSSQRDTYYSSFRGSEYGNERDGWSRSVAPIVWVQHQSSVSSLLEIFSEEFFQLKSDIQLRAANFQKLIRYQMFRKQDGYRRLYDFFYNACIYHYGVWKVYYKEDYDIVYETVDRMTVDEMMQLLQNPLTTASKYTEAEDEATGQIYYENVKVAKKVVTYAGPAFECLPNTEFYYSPDCRITEWGGIDGRMVFHEVRRSLNDIRKRERAGIYKSGTYARCKEIGGDKEITDEERSYRYDTDGLSEVPEDSDGKIELAKELTVKECYCKMDIDGDGLLEPCIVVIIEDEVVAQAGENPYGRPPFRIGGMLPEPHKVHGISPAEVLNNDQKIMTNLLRFIQDSAAMSAYRNVITNDVRMQHMLATRKPFDVILGDPGKIGEVPVQPPDQFILRAWEVLKGEMEEKTGQSRYNQGLDAESLNKTATGVSLIAQASARRLRMSARLLGEGPITGLVRDFIFINQKWRTEDPQKLLGTDIVVNPEDLDGEYDIEIDIGVSPSEKQATANQVEMLIQFGTQVGVPMGLMTPLHIMRLIKQKYNLLGVNVDDGLISEKEWQQKQEEQAKKPPQEDWKEFVNVDKLYPALTRKEQMQILQKLGIQPDVQGQIAGILTARDVADVKMEQQKNKGNGQGDQMAAIQDLIMKREKHKMDLQGKVIDNQTKLEGYNMARKKHRAEIMAKGIDTALKLRKADNAERSERQTRQD
jgi:hypothetical protein